MSKIKHPSNRAERLKIKVRKDKKLHENASPVYKLLREKELIDAEAPRLPRDWDLCFYL